MGFLKIEFDIICNSQCLIIIGILYAAKQTDIP